MTPALLLWLALGSAPSPKAYVTMGVPGRRAAMSSLAPAARAALLERLTLAQWVAMGRQALAGMPGYQARLTKQERVRGEIRPAQTMRVEVRAHPLAVRLQVLAGPPKGRKVLYNAALKPGEVRVREPGFLGSVVGAVWVDADGSLARRDTRHPITDLPFGHFLAVLAHDVRLAAPAGGLHPKPLGLDGKGRFCLRTATPKAVKTYARRSTLCFDPVLGLPLKAEMEDGRGFLERFSFSQLRSRRFQAGHFTPKAFGL